MKIKPEIGVSAFVPHACDIIDDLLTEDMIEQQQLIDEELKFNMHILAEVRILLHTYFYEFICLKTANILGFNVTAFRTG